MTRPLKLTPELQADIMQYLTLGMPVSDVCALVGIHEATYYAWTQRGRRGWKTDQVYIEFSEASQRAQVSARVSAVSAIRQAMVKHDQTTNTTETFTETRTRTVKHTVNGVETVEQVPYEYKRVNQGTSVTAMLPDWRAAVEYLKRRDPKNWSEKFLVELGLNPDLLKRLDDVAKEAETTPAELFEGMLNAIADQLSTGSQQRLGGAADSE